MRSILIVIALLCASCSLFDDYGPCPDTSSPTPGPGGPQGPDDPLPPGDYADGDRYRKLQDGTVCVCGPYAVGCHETPEGAEGSKVCSYGPEGQMCDDAPELPPPPSTSWDNEAGEWTDASEPVRKWRCPYKWRAKRPGDEWRHEERIRMAQNYVKANTSHFAWCSRKTDKNFEFVCSDCDTTPVP